jgi:hypothetical protein
MLVLFGYAGVDEKLSFKTYRYSSRLQHTVPFEPCRVGRIVEVHLTCSIDAYMLGGRAKLAFEDTLRDLERYMKLLKYTENKSAVPEWTVIVLYGYIDKSLSSEHRTTDELKILEL